MQPVSRGGENLGSCPCQDSFPHAPRHLHISFHATPNSGISSGARDETLTSAEHLGDRLPSNCQPFLTFTPPFLRVSLLSCRLRNQSRHLLIACLLNHRRIQADTRPRNQLFSRVDVPCMPSRNYPACAHSMAHQSTSNSIPAANEPQPLSEDNGPQKLLVSVAAKCDCLLECNNAL